jgi:hypothetical protein
MSTFATLKDKPISQKIVLVEIDLPQDQEIFLNYEAGIWFYQFFWNAATITGSDGLIGYYEGEIPEVNAIGSLKVNNESYTQVSEIQDVRDNNKSFNFDRGTQRLYIHFDGYEPPLDKVVTLGLTSGFSNSPQIVDGRPKLSYYNDIFYAPRIKSIPQINKQKDPLSYGLIAFQGGNIELDNTDGYFDDFVENDIFGQPVRILIGFDDLDYAQYRKVFTGYIEDFTVTRTSFSITAQDKRKSLSRELPTNRFTVADYSDLNEDSVDKPKPLAWGAVRGAPCVCLDEDGAPANYSFMFLDTTNHPANALTAAYVDGEAVAIASSDLSAGTFTIASANYTPGQEVTADFTGFEDDDGNAIVNGLDVILDILEHYDSKSFIDENFNISEWNSETLRAANIALWIGDGEELKISEAIEKICVSLWGIFLVQDDGLFTFRSYYDSRAITRNILSDEWIGDPKISYPSEYYLTSAKIQYDKHISGGNYKSFVNKDYEADTWEIYKVYIEKELETLLASSSDADNLSERVLLISKQIYKNVVRKTKTQHIDLDLMQFVVCEHSRPFLDAPDWGVYEIIGIQKNLSSFEVTLTLRYVEDYTWPESPSYVQGIIWFDKIFGDKIHAVTSY